MAAIFLEIVIDAVAPEDRHQIEGRLDAALDAASVGEVSGGGTGGAISNIDVEVTTSRSGLR